MARLGFRGGKRIRVTHRGPAWRVQGESWSAKTILTAPFSAPAANADDVAQVQSAVQFKIGQRVWIEPIGYFEVIDKVE